MKTRKVLILFLCFTFSGLGAALAAEEKLKYTGTFSSLQFNKEGGDLLGAEIKIVLTRTGYQGALQIAEGPISQFMVVEVFFEKDNIRFEIPTMYTPYGGGIFEGKIDSRGIKGTFRFKGVEGEQETLIRGRSYWDR